MKDPSFTLRDAYSTLFTGAIFHKGNPIGVFDGFAPQGIPTPYVILGPQTVVPREGSRCNFMSDCSIVVLVITSFPAQDSGNKKFADDISNQITHIVVPDPSSNIDLLPEFLSLKSKVDGITTGTRQDNTDKYHEKAIRFYHLIKEV